tara:strand:+ start:180 stop:404 length:225 start_codon:yes stop_codon:yes gene_type:complete
MRKEEFRIGDLWNFKNPDGIMRNQTYVSKDAIFLILDIWKGEDYTMVSYHDSSDGAVHEQREPIWILCDRIGNC